MERLHIGLAVCCILAACVSISFADTLQTEPACDGLGVRGFRSENLTTVHFESCQTKAGVRSRIWKNAPIGVPMTELVLEGRSLTYRIAGIELSPALDEQEIARMREVMESPESDVAIGLWAGLRRQGHTTESPAMAALAANLVGYQVKESSDGVPRGNSASSDCSDESEDCLGCCGFGCSGCMHVCTWACRAHDLCVRSNKTFLAKECMMKLIRAIDSIAECAGHCIGPECIRCW